MTIREALEAMVREAEETLQSYKEDMDDWSYAEYDGRKHSYEDLAPGLAAALIAARAALTKDTP